MLTDEQKKQVGEAFDDIDSTRKGHIPGTKESLLEAARLSGLNPTEKDMERHMQDIEFGEQVTRTELMDFLCKFDWKDADDVRERLKADFEMFDTSGKGALDAVELKNIMTREGPEAIPEKDVDEIIEKFMKEPNGKYKIDNLVSTLLA